MFAKVLSFITSGTLLSPFLANYYFHEPHISQESVPLSYTPRYGKLLLDVLLPTVDVRFVLTRPQECRCILSLGQWFSAFLILRLTLEYSSLYSGDPQA